MSKEIKVYLDDSKDESSLCFHATIHSDSDYDVYYDLNETYEVLLSEALQNNLNIKFLDKRFTEQQLHIKSIEEFKNYLVDFYDLEVELNSLEFHNLVGVRLVGDGYRYNEDIPMLETKEHNVINSLHNIRTTLIDAINDPNYNGDDIYSKKKAGSLVVTLETIKEYKEHIDFMKDIYRDIKDEKINPFKFNDNNKKECYQKIVQSISELNNQKKLKEFYLIIDNKEYQIENRGYLKNISKEIYFEEVEINGEYQGYKKGSNSFEIKQEFGNKKYYCHLDKLQLNDKGAYNRAMELLKIIGIDMYSKKIMVKITGKKIKPQTIEIAKIEKLQ